ncbi:hypothetical protein [Actinokineospora bangkokensis]|uniref:RNA polymerase subunit sigma-70 n=1 Tax=Actinokineospora bangkokensis TaxID=1193682 RepID=A0A1Q9LER3_9PSEU|nr:hypothetical protein [Actinokineospora bangkokensis]OLR90531.1 hypothetical protein BJP25_28285 [Actinokineospora bangkokensis]
MDTLELPGHRGAVAANTPSCTCGWHGDPGPDASGTWWRHAIGALEAEPPQWLLAKSDTLREQVRELTASRPDVALKLLAEVDRWTRPMTEAAVAAARARGATWSEVGAALGVSRQAAHERFRSIG